jgi:hypothetical protein
VFRRYLAFLILNLISKKLYNEFNKAQQRNQQQQAGANSKNNVYVHPNEASNPKQRKFKDDEGEYVDYEEVK